MSGNPPADVDTIDAGKRLVRVALPSRGSLRDKILDHIVRMTWRTPLHAIRLRGRFPLKLLTVPDDPVRGDAARGRAMLGGMIHWHGESQDVASCSFTEDSWSSGFASYMHSFAWLRDLGALNDREATAPLAEHLMRAWLSAHGETISDAAWRADLAGARILFWTAYAPLILSSADVVYRSAVLNALARTARHLERVARRTPAGSIQIEAWAGVIAAGLLMPGGEARRSVGEAGINKALLAGLTQDGGPLCRRPDRLMALVSALSMLDKVYDSRGQRSDVCVEEALNQIVAALMGLTLGDGGLSSWQGALPASKVEVDALVRASAARTRPLLQARDWGYQRLQQGQTILIADTAPPPVGRAMGAGCASTLAFELSDGPHRLIVNCGGANAGEGGVPAPLSQALRTTAAHSTLTLADSNSTAILADGSLGKGVTEVELDRHDSDAGSRIEASHDGYAKRFGLLHRRTLTLRPDGADLRGEDVLLPARGRKAANVSFAVRFHLGVGVDTSPTADGSGALLRLPSGQLWQFRCQGGVFSIDDSIWIDGEGRMHATQQLVISGGAPAGGASVSWVLKRAG